MDTVNDIKMAVNSEPDNNEKSRAIESNLLKNSQEKNNMTSEPIPSLRGKVELLNKVNVDLLEPKPISNHSSPFERIRSTDSPPHFSTVRPRSPLDLVNHDSPSQLHSDIVKPDPKRVRSEFSDHPMTHHSSINSASERRVSLPHYDSHSPYERNTGPVQTKLPSNLTHELKSNVGLADVDNLSHRLPYQMPALQDNSSLSVVEVRAHPVSLIDNMVEMDTIQYPPKSQPLSHTYNHRSLIPDYSNMINSIVKIRIARSYLKWGWFHDKIRDHEVWGSMVYTDDSDILAVLVHLGYLRLPQPPPIYNSTTPNSLCVPGISQGFNLINDWIVEIRILPKLTRYSGTDLKGYKSRSWMDDHDGVSFQVLKVYLATGGSDDRMGNTIHKSI